MTRLPSGAQIELSHAHQVVHVTEVGAALRQYSVAGRDLLDGYSADEMCTGARGHSLIPWPNRVAAGHYRFDGRDLQLDLTEPPTGNAIHGLTRWDNWTLADRDDSRAVFRHVLHCRPGWPFALDLQIEYVVDAGGLTVRTTATNSGTTDCPYGTGAHPYVSLGIPTIDPMDVSVPGALYYPVDDKGIPTGREPVDGTRYDLRTAAVLGDRHIDVAYTELTRDADGRARVRLRAPDGTAAALWVDAAYPYLEIFTGDTLPEPSRHRTGLGIEPMTCAPDAYNSGDGLIRLAPGETHSAQWGIEPHVDA